MTADDEPAATTPLLSGHAISKYFRQPKGLLWRAASEVRAVHQVNIQVGAQQHVGLVGESGCGKTALAKTLVRLQPPTHGRIVFDGVDITKLSYRQMRPFKRHLQFIFQNPTTALPPHMTVEATLTEVLRGHQVVPRNRTSAEIDRLLDICELPRNVRARYPKELSVGQCQRVGIARCIAVRPRLVVADEPISALDVSVQAAILNLLLDIADNDGLSYLFIAHDLAVVERFCDRIYVMHAGQIVEELSCRDLAHRLRHPYSRMLWDAQLRVAPKQQKPLDTLPTSASRRDAATGGCSFQSRCPQARDVCRTREPVLLPQNDDHRVACHAFPARAGSH